MPFILLMLAVLIFAITKGLIIEASPIVFFITASLYIHFNKEKAKNILDPYF
ncbi:hypothetical protein [Nitrosophilus labii]|uniref:hypothetical protein n=1 Tax=Nitrosophilus labii TaxID=2706014 RepID=UPI00165741A7|nr:hypothetical protein [Nitrosophilus labii]